MSDTEGYRTVSRKALRAARAQELAAEAGEQATWGEAWDEARAQASRQVGEVDGAEVPVRSAREIISEIDTAVSPAADADYEVPFEFDVAQRPATTPVRRSAAAMPPPTASPAKTPPSAHPMRSVGAAQGRVGVSRSAAPAYPAMPPSIPPANVALPEVGFVPFEPIVVEEELEEPVVVPVAPLVTLVDRQHHNPYFAPIAPAVVVSEATVVAEPSVEPAPVPESVIDTAVSSSESFAAPAPYRSAGYTWVHYLILLAVACVFGLLLWQLINGGGEPLVSGASFVWFGVSGLARKTKRNAICHTTTQIGASR